MRFLSSIFNFDTLQLRGGAPRGLLTAVALLAALDFGLSRADWPYRRNPASYVGAFLAQEQSLRDDSLAPRVIILGNSRSKVGLIPRELERLMNLPEGAVLNLSIESGDHYDTYLFQLRNRQLLKSARLLIYGTDAYQFNAYFPLSDRFHHFAGLGDRLRLEPTAECLFGYFFRTGEKAGLYHGMFRTFKNCVVTAFRPVETPQTHTPARDQLAAPIPLGPVEDPVKFWYENFTVSPSRHALMEQVVRTAHEDGQRVMILQLPFRDEYMREVFHSHAADYDAYKRSIESLQNVQVALFEKASNCRLGPADFSDWSHLNEAGATKFTRLLCDWLTAHDQETIAAIADTKH